MQVFFEDEKEVGLFLSRLAGVRCPFCQAVGALVRHGYLRWGKGPKGGDIRGWRIRCKGNSRHPGCGRTHSLRLGQTLPRRYFSASDLWAFLRELLDARSIKSAWERSGLPMSLDTAYRLWRRLILCQSALRTRLSGRSPPPKAKAGVPLLHVLAHLKKVFSGPQPITAYQLSFQRNFLAVT